MLAACGSSGPIHEPTPLQPLTAENVVERHWTLSATAGRLDPIYDHLQPAVEGDVLYTARAKGEVRAVSLASGKKRWKTRLDVVISGGVGLGDELLFVGTADAEVIALDRESGQERWRAPVFAEVLAAPVATTGYVIVRCSDGRVVALNSETGQRLWLRQWPVPLLTLRGDSRPVIADNMVLVGLADGRLAALSIYDGRSLWEAVVVAPQGRTDLERMVDVDATPLVMDGRVYVAAHQGRVAALALETGGSLWSADIGSATGMVSDGEALYVVDDMDQVWALDLRSGRSLWKQDKLKYRRLSPPALFGDALLAVADFEGYTHWLALEDGRLVARYQVGGEEVEAVAVAPQVVDGIGYVRSELGRIEALGLRPAGP